VLAPEYGGDGGKAIGPCAAKHQPVATFPAHWAPNDLALYYGKQFPTAYRNGAFIAFHGSWNRAPLQQQGYNVVFQPLANGSASGKYVVFADGFAGGKLDPGAAAHRPAGLAVAPDGALLVADDVQGRIWRITYQGGNPAAKVAAASVPNASVTSSATTVTADPLPPEGIHPDAGANDTGMPVLPPGATAQLVALGSQIYHGQVGGAPCAGCHGADGKGTPMGADLAAGKWLWGDGSIPALTKSIVDGVPNPKAHTGVIPPNGGGNLSPQQVSAVAAYVWTLGHQGAQK
jgi:mono/diheme cytochrome c family protein